MPLLDIATAQTSLQNHLGLLRAQSLVLVKVFSSPFICGDEKLLLWGGKSLHAPRNVISNWRNNRLQIKAVATLEPKSLVHRKDGKKGSKSEAGVSPEPSATEVPDSNTDLMDLDDREKLRRMRISKANKGNTPWNKGRKHSAETLQRIRERTRIAMQDPKVKMKLAYLGHAQSKATREKIGIGVRMGWQKRREKRMIQETCHFEWQNLIAEASRRGFTGEEELQWDSYKIMSEKLKVEWVESIEQRKAMPRPKGNKRAPKSLEQRRKIAEAIAAKWADPEYRDRVQSGLAKYHGMPGEGERKRRRRPSRSAQSLEQDPVDRKTSRTNYSSRNGSSTLVERVKSRKSRKPLYKDPMASSKFEMLKSIRAQRAAEETEKVEAIKRARSLVAEAEKAAEVLEAAARKSPVAQASLIETRKLIAEAIKYLESIDMGYATPSGNESSPSVLPTELLWQFEKESNTDGGGSDLAKMHKVNGTKIDEGLGFANLTLHDALNGEKELLPMSSSAYCLSPFELEHLMGQSSSAKQPKQVEPNGHLKSEMSPLPNGAKIQHLEEKTSSDAEATPVKKIWVRGRLVEATEEC